MPPKSKRARAGASSAPTDGGGSAGSSARGGATTPSTALPLVGIGPRTSGRARKQRFPDLDLSQLAAPSDDGNDVDEDEDDGQKKAVPKRKRKKAVTSSTKKKTECTLSPADNALQLKLDPLINKLTAQYKESTTPEAQKKAMALLFSSDPSGSRQTEATAMHLDYEYQNSGLLSLPDELMLLIFKFFQDKPLCLGRLSMSCKQLYMLTSSDSVIGSIWRRAFYEIDVTEKAVKIGYNQAGKESITVEVPKGMMVPAEVDQSNWNQRRHHWGRGRTVGIQETRKGPETFDISSIEDVDTGKTMVTVTRTDGGADSPGWKFDLSFTGEISGEALSLLDGDADETMASSDWKDQYIELLYFKIPGRCSVCRSKTTNEAVEALHVRLCKSCTVTGVMTTTNVKKMFSLNKTDLEGVPSVRQGGGTVYLKRHVLRIAIEKCGGKDKFTAKETAKRAKKAKADYSKHKQMQHASLVEKALAALDVTITVKDMINNDIDAASKLDKFIKSDRPDGQWCSGVTELMEACKSEGSKLLRQDAIRKMLVKDSKMEQNIRSQHLKDQNPYYSYMSFGGGAELGDGNTTGWLKRDGPIYRDQAKHFPLVQKYLLDGEEVDDPDAADGSNFTEASFFAWWNAKVKERSAKIEELKALVNGKAQELKMSIYMSPFTRSAAYKKIYTMTVFPENFDQLLADIVAECDGAIKQNATDIEQREKASQAAKEKAKEKDSQMSLLQKQTLATVMEKVAAESPELVPTDKDLKLFKDGMSWFEGKEQASGFHGYGYNATKYNFKAGALGLLFSHNVALPLKAAVRTQLDAKAHDERRNQHVPGYQSTPVTIPQSKIDELIADYKKNIETSKEYTAAQVKKGSQQRIPLLMEDAAVKIALGGNDLLSDPFYIFRSAVELYETAALTPVMVQAPNANRWHMVESETLPWKCARNAHDGLTKDAHEASCLCGDGGPALFKVAVLAWSARRDALFEWMATKGTTLPELMKKGQSVREELCKYLAQPFIKCNPAVMAKHKLASLAPRPEEDGDDQAGPAAESMALLAGKIDEHGKNLQLRVQALKKVRVPVQEDKEHVDFGSLVDAIIEENNDKAAKFVTDQMEVEHGAEGKARYGYQPTETDMKQVGSFGYQFQSYPHGRSINNLHAKMGAGFPSNEVIDVLDGRMAVEDFQELVNQKAFSLKLRNGRQKEADVMIEKIFGKDDTHNASTQRLVSNALARFLHSGAAAEKANLLAALKTTKAKMNDATAKESVEADRKAKLNDELKLCPKWIMLQDPVQLHVRSECAEYQTYRHAKSSEKVEDAAFVAQKMEEMSIKFQTCSKATLTTVASMRKETTTREIGGTSYIIKERDPNARKKKDTWHEKKESASRSRGQRGYGYHLYH